MDRPSQIMVISIINHDLYHQKLINSFMHRIFVGKANQPIV